MKILFFAYHFPPDPAVGALRPGRIVRALADRGHEVHVISSPLPGQPSVVASAGVTVERVEPWLDLRAAYARLKQRLSGRTAAPGPAPAGGDVAAWVPPERTPFWKRQFLALLWLPDDRQGWMAAALRRARALAADGFDLLYTSAPPYSVHLAGLLVRRRLRGSPWIAEYRDPWTDNPWKPDFVRTGWSDAIDRRLERMCLETPDRLVCATESVAGRFRARLENGDKVVVVRNGIDVPGSDPPDGPGNGRILYVGNLYHARDPRPFLRAFARLHSAGRLQPGTGVDFVGACSHFQGIELRAFAAELGIGELVQVHEPVPHDVCLAMMRDASVLLLLAQDQPLQVPNKLYEYFGAGRHILAIADVDGETARMLREMDGHQIAAGEDPAAIEMAIAASLEAARGGCPTGGQRKLREWSVASQMDRLVELIERGSDLRMATRRRAARQVDTGNGHGPGDPS